MGRDVLRVDGVSAEVKAALQQAAMVRYGKPNASLLVRGLIADAVKNQAGVKHVLTEADAADSVRVEIRLPRAVVEQIEREAEERLSPKSYFLASIILQQMGVPMLQGDEIEVLRRSNFELRKIGSNVNQIAKAFNLLVQARGDGKMPEIGKKMAALKTEINDHTSKVLRVLEAGTTVWENSGKGRGNRKQKSK